MIYFDVGAAESGKSTLVKQMKIIHSHGFTKQELASFKVRHLTMFCSFHTLDAQQCKRLITFNRLTFVHYYILSVHSVLHPPCGKSSRCVRLGIISSLRGHWFSCETGPQLNRRLDLASACLICSVWKRKRKGEGNTWKHETEKL